MESNVQKIKSVSFSTLQSDAELTSILLRTYSVLFCKTPKFCATALREYYNLVITQGNQRLEHMEKNQEYKLKKGVRIYIQPKGKHYTSFNMTDEIAIELLRDNPSLKSKFESIPEKKLTAAEMVKLIKATDKIEDLETYKDVDFKSVKEALAKRTTELS